MGKSGPMSAFSNLKITYKLVFAFMCLIAASMLSYGMIYWQRAALSESLQQAEQTKKILEGMDLILAALVDQQGSLRAFIITGDAPRLDRYKVAEGDYKVQLERLKEFNANEPEQLRRLDELDARAKSWHTEMAEPAIGMMAQPEGSKLAGDLERSGIGKKWFDATRAKIDELNAYGDNLLAVQSQQQADSLTNITRAIGVGAALMLVATIGLVIVMTRAISKPIEGLTAAMGKLASGDLITKVQGTDRGDEIGSMAQAVQVFKDNMIAADGMRSAQVRAEEEKEQRQRVVTEAIKSFETVIGRIVETVSSTSGQLETAAGTLTKTADTTQQLSTMVAAASEQTSANVQGVAAASEQLSSTVSEIGRQVQESSSIAGQAVTQATKTNDRVTELSRSADRIGDVIGLINTIAGQTNLLALNATIEAARAGDAGKGFAVVAQEVKALADQTAKATNEIATQIASMQSATQDAVIAIQEIAGTINKMSEISGAIAAAVEQQGATTQEISRNVMEAAKGTSEVASSITDVSRGASETGSESANVLSSAKHLSSESMRLRAEVERFLTTVRAA
jgi:methyl-accepting chemotaxis protein